jgi:hypothetical protein
MAKVTYRGVEYDTNRSPKTTSVKKKFMYRGIEYTDTQKVEVSK